MNCFMQPLPKPTAKDPPLSPDEQELLRDLQELAGIEPTGVEEEDEPSKSFKGSLIFFDFESRQFREHRLDKQGNPVLAHDPNLCVVHKVCDECKDNAAIWTDKTTDCEKCVKNRHVFKGRDDFCSWLFGGDNNGCIALAHNSKGYDAHFIFR